MTKIMQIRPVYFAELLEQKALNIQKRTEENFKFINWIERIFGFYKHSLDALTKDCHSLFDHIERRATVFSLDKTKTHEQEIVYCACLKTAKVVTNFLATSKEMKEDLESIVQKIIGLQYRIESCNGGVDKSPVDMQLTENLCTLALKWKSDHPLIKRKELTAAEIKKLEETSTYLLFANEMLKNVTLQEAFFSWILRDNNGVAQFVEFPAISARIKNSYLASRIGKLGASLFSIQKHDNGDLQEKVICLPFFINNQIEFISLLDETKEIELGGWRLTLEKVFQVFAKKNQEIGNLEFFQSRGITNWNCLQVGSWNSLKNTYNHLDLTVANWWKALPILEEVSKEQLEQRLDETLEPNQWVVSAKSARTTPDMDLVGCHGYIEIAIPTEKGTYCIYPMGKFAETFPHSALELASFVTNTLPAKVSYPDENFFYSHRQQATVPFKLTAEEGMVLMKEIRKELLMARFGYKIFQFGAENCAYWAQKILSFFHKTKHNFYKLDFLDSYPKNPMLKGMFAFFRSFPVSVRPYVIRAVDNILGSWRKIEVFENGKKVVKSHKTSPVRNEFVIYQPGYLHQQIEEGVLKGTITVGNC